jgi:hypothetical protein
MPFFELITTDNTVFDSLDDRGRFLMVIKVALLRAIELMISCVQQLKWFTTSLTYLCDVRGLIVGHTAIIGAEFLSFARWVGFKILTAMQASRTIGDFSACNHAVINPLVLGFSSDSWWAVGDEANLVGRS